MKTYEFRGSFKPEGVGIAELTSLDVQVATARMKAEYTLLDGTPQSYEGPCTEAPLDLRKVSATLVKHMDEGLVMSKTPGVKTEVVEVARNLRLG